MTTGKKLSGDKWFAEFDLTVLDSASGWGNFFFVEQTVQTEDRQFAFVNIPINTDAALPMILSVCMLIPSILR